MPSPKRVIPKTTRMQLRLITLLSILLSCTRVSAQKNHPSIIDSLQLTLQTFAQQNEVAGFAVAIVDDNGILFEKGYGYADYQHKAPYTTSTTQNIASISKTFIGISLLQAEKEGLLSMEDPINKYLPFKVVHPKFPDQPILLKHLANHTAGISDDKRYDLSYSLTEPFTTPKGAVDKWEYKEMRMISKQNGMELGEFLQSFLTRREKLYHKKNFRNAAPGVEYEYSNVGAALAAFVLESASGIPFPEWTKSHIFKPLGMDNTGWSVADVDPDTYFTHHYMNNEPMPNYRLSTYPDGGVITSVHQLGLYLSAAMNGRQNGNAVLSAKDYNRLFSNAVIAKGDNGKYGYFWEITDDGFWGHTGGDPGVVTLMRSKTDSRHGFVVFFNGYASNNNFYRGVVGALIEAGEQLTVE